MEEKLIPVDLTREEIRAVIEHRKTAAKECLDCGAYSFMDGHIKRVKQLWKILG